MLGLNDDSRDTYDGKVINHTTSYETMAQQQIKNFKNARKQYNHKNKCTDTNEGGQSFWGKHER